MAESYTIDTAADKTGAAQEARRQRALERSRRKQQARTARQQKKGTRSQNPSIKATPPPKKLTGPIFGLMVLLALIKDVLDVIFGITLILIILAKLITIPIALIVFAYYKFNGVKFTTRKLATFAISYIIEMIPFIGWLPMATTSLLVIRQMENSERLKKFAQTQTTIKA